MKKGLFFSILVLAIAGTSLNSLAQNPFFKLDSLYQKGLVSSDQYILNKFYYQFNRAMVNPDFFHTNDSPVFCMSPLYSEFSRLKANNLISQTTIQTIQGMGGGAYILGSLDANFTTEHFKIHYSITPGNPNKIPDQYIDGQVPSLIPLIGQFAEEIFLKYQEIGFQMPIDISGNQIGDGKYNIGIDGTGDYAHTSTNQPNNLLVGEELSYMLLPLKGVQYLNNDNPNKFHGMLMYSIAHEFKHAIQLTYDSNRFSSILRDFDEMDAEGSIECVLDDNNYVLYGNTPIFKSHPEIGIKNSITGYSEWVWHQFLSEYIHGPNSTHPKVLSDLLVELSVQKNFYASYDNAIYVNSNDTKDLSDCIYSFWCWNLFTGTERSVTNYGHEEALKMKPVTNIGSIDQLPIDFQQYGINSTACLYYSIPTSLFIGGYKLKLTFSSLALSDPEKKVKLFYAGIKDHLLNLIEISQSQATYLDTDYDQIFLIVINGDHFYEGQKKFSISMEKYGVNLQFSNKIENENAGGDLLIETISKQLHSGDYQVLFKDESHIITSLLSTAEISSKPGVKHKQNNWNGISTSYMKKNTFTVTPNNHQSAQFKESSQICINIAYDGIPSTEPSVTSFIQDPWVTQNQIDFLPAFGSKEVFLGEAPDPQKPLKPYYQIKTDRVKVGTGTLAGINFYFLNWSSTGTEPLVEAQTEAQPVVFTSAGATVTANYKTMLASKATGWVGTQFASNNGTSSVMYVSNGNLWLHRENGSDKKEILVSSSAGSISSYSVTANANNRYWVLNNGTTTLTSGHEINGVVSSSSIPTLTGIPSGRVEIMRINSSTPKLVLITKVGLSICKSIGTLTDSGVTWAPWTSITVGGPSIQVAGNGNVAYVSWINASSVLGYRLNSDGSWSSLKVITSSSSGSFTSLATAANGSNGLDLVLVRANSQTNKKDLAVSAWNADNTTLPLTVLSTSTTYGDFKAVSLSSNSGLKLASVGVSTYVPNYSYYLWKHDHTSWSQESSPFSTTEQKLFHQEVTFTPSKATVGALEVMTPNPVNWGGMTKITTGTDEQPVLSISGVQLTDTLVYNVNMDPAIVDSIIIDTVGVWSIAVKGSGFVTETVNDLKLFGSSELIVSTSESGTSRSIQFKPNLVKWDVWVVDPSGNKVRMGKENSDEESDSESIKTEVAVYPNPFNPETRINIRLAEPAELKVRVYNVVGQLVADLANGHHDMGDYSFRFDGKSLASGTYFYRVEIGEKVKTGKIQLLK